MGGPPHISPCQLKQAHTSLGLTPIPSMLCLASHRWCQSRHRAGPAPLPQPHRREWGHEVSEQRWEREPLRREGPWLFSLPSTRTRLAPRSLWAALAQSPTVRCVCHHSACRGRATCERTVLALHSQKPHSGGPSEKVGLVWGTLQVPKSGSGAG